MIWATHLISLLALAASLPLSEAVDVKPVTLDVWAPKVLYPHSGTIWYTGQYHNVTWYVNTFLSSVLAHIMLFAGITANPLVT